MPDSEQGTAGRVAARSSASGTSKRDRSSTNGRSSSSADVKAPAKKAPMRAQGKTPGKAPRRPRKARLRLTQIDAWTVMKTSFLLSIAMGIVTVVAVAIVWTVLGAAGVFDSLNNTVQKVMGNDFRVQDYIGTGRVLGFTMLVAVVDVVLLTAIATLGAFLYNLSATLLGGVEVELSEDA